MGVRDLLGLRVALVPLEGGGGELGIGELGPCREGLRGEHVASLGSIELGAISGPDLHDVDGGRGRGVAGRRLGNVGLIRRFGGASDRRGVLSRLLGRGGLVLLWGRGVARLRIGLRGLFCRRLSGIVRRGLGGRFVVLALLCRNLARSGLGLRRRRELVDCLGERGRRHEGRRRNEREQQREHALCQRFFGFHIPRLLPFRGPGGQVGSAGCAPAIRPSQRADARRREQASLEHSLSTDPESNRNPFFSTRRSSCSNRALNYSDGTQFSSTAGSQDVDGALLLPARNRP